MEKPPLKKRGKPSGAAFEQAQAIIAATENGGYELKGDFDRTSSTKMRRLLNYHGGKIGLHFSVNITADNGLWIERMPRDGSPAERP